MGPAACAACAGGADGGSRFQDVVHTPRVFVVPSALMGDFFTGQAIWFTVPAIFGTLAFVEYGTESKLKTTGEVGVGGVDGTGSSG